MRVVLSFVCIMLLCGIYSCKTVTSDPNIINGVEDKDKLFPAVLPIEVDYKDTEGKEYLHRCTSAVISSNTILTAAHCFKDAVVGHIGVINEKGEKILAKAFYAMDGYKKKQSISEDIGILVFDKPVFKNISPLKISNQKVKRGDPILHIGYSGPTDIVNGEIIHYVFEGNPVRKWGYNLVLYDVCNVEDVDNCFATGSVVDNMYLDIEKRKDTVGIGSVPFEGDSGGPVLSYKKQNLILGVVAYMTISDNVVFGENLTFDDNIINWLRKINKETEANIPFDEIK